MGDGETVDQASADDLPEKQVLGLSIRTCCTGELSSVPHWLFEE